MARLGREPGYWDEPKEKTSAAQEKIDAAYRAKGVAEMKAKKALEDEKKKTIDESKKYQAIQDKLLKMK